MAFDRTAAAILVSVRKAGSSKTEPFDLEGRILSFTFDDDEKNSDKATLTLDNFDLSLFENSNLVPGSLLDITWGYNGLFSQTQSLVVKSIKGSITLSISAESKKQLINREHNNRVFEGMTRSEVAQQIAEENGFSSDRVFVDNTEVKFETITQARMTDAQFLRHLANKEGFEWYVDASGFHFHEREFDAEPVRKFTWYNDPDQGDILSFSIEEKTNAKAGRVTAKGRDPSKKKTHSADADSSTEKDGKFLTEFVVIPGGAGLKKVTVEKPSGNAADNVSTTDTMPTSASSAEAGKREAKGRYRRSATNNVKLTMNAIGDPEITAKTNIQVEGIGQTYSGLYYVEKIKHAITNSGYTMNMTCKRQGRSTNVGAKAQGKVNKQTAPNKKSKDKKPETVLVPSPDGSGLVKKTVYK